jgi:hypothetical protein
MGVAEMAHLRRTRPAHAPTHNNVGGYMRGEGKKEMASKYGARQGMQCLITGTAATVAPSCCARSCTLRRL